MSWIILDPEPDITIQSGFTNPNDAIEWRLNQIGNETNPDRLAVLQRCVITPYDPERLT